jgi:adenine-specific DNA-methyltransferase
MSIAEKTNNQTAAAAVTAEPERFDLRSHDIEADKQAELLWLFPDIRTEAGKIDFDRLKRALGETIDPGKERYGMNWPGKVDCFRTIQTPSLGTLRPCPEESIKFDVTENLIIEGDNLEVLKLLQKSYLGKVKMIYIDPPYNTGSDFIYPDNYTETLQTYLEYTGQVDSEGKKFGTNTEADGRFHSKWLNMMCPRLYLARNLLREEGAIFISIDDGEAPNVRRLCDEIFGEENFVATFIWEKRTTRENRRVFSFNHDYIVSYAKRKELFEVARNFLPLTEEARSRYQNVDNDPRGSWQSVSLNAQAGHATPSQFYEITTPGGRKINPPPGRCWSVTEPRLKELIADKRIWFGADGNNVPRLKVFLSEANDGLTPHTLWTATEVGTTDSAKKALNELFDGRAVYDTPKPVPLIQRICHIATTSSSPEPDIVLDFFAGSGSTAEAVLDLNRAEDGNRRFILVQLPEPLDPSDINQKEAADFCRSIGKPETIIEITKERARRVIKRFDEKDTDKLELSDKAKQDRGFRVLRLADSNFKPWDAEASKHEAALAQQLEMHIDHIRDGRTAADILYELLLKSGFPPTTHVDEKTLSGKTVYSVADGALVICLERSLTLELIRAIAEIKPERVVCLDEGFAGNDQLKANAVQTFKTKGITSFKTV